MSDGVCLTECGGRVHADAPEQLAAMLEAAHAKAVAGGTTKADVLSAVAAARNVPPHNPAATTGEEAYRCRRQTMLLGMMLPGTILLGMTMLGIIMLGCFYHISSDR